MFKDINEAYNILSDERKRKIYDEGGHPDDPNSAFHTKQTDQNFDEIYKQYFGTEYKAKTSGFKNDTGKNF